jgi:hypothetical protein
MFSLPWSDACRLAQRRDALIRWRALSERSELVRPPKAGAVRSNEARRGVTGFGPFCRNKRASPAGAKPGNTENHVDTSVGHTRAMCSPANVFTGKPQDEFPINIIKLQGQNHRLCMIPFNKFRIALWPRHYKNFPCQPVHS